MSDANPTMTKAMAKPKIGSCRSLFSTWRIGTRSEAPGLLRDGTRICYPAGVLSRRFCSADFTDAERPPRLTPHNLRRHRWIRRYQVSPKIRGSSHLKLALCNARCRNPRARNLKLVQTGGGVPKNTLEP